MAKEIYSFDDDKMVAVEPPKKEEKQPEDTSAPDEENEEEPEEGEEEEKKEEASEDDNTKEELEEEIESEEHPAEEEQEKTESKSDETPDSEITPDEVIQDLFSEKYGIKSESEFQEILDQSIELLDENQKLEAKIKELESAPKGPAFKSENQKAIYEMIKDYDPDRVPDGLSMIASLVGMDLKTTDTKLILQQEFIMQHPELSIDRARKKFENEYNKLYAIDEESFDDAEKLKEKKEDVESDLIIARKRATKFIQEKQQEFKTKSEEKEESAKVNEEVQASIAKTTSEFNEYFDGLHTLVIPKEEGDKTPFKYKFSTEELKRIKIVVDNHLKNPGAYDAKGKLVGGFDAHQNFETAAFAVCGLRITEEALKFAKNMAQRMKAEDIAKRKPERKSSEKSQPVSMSIDAQAERLAQKKKAERS